MTAGFSDADTLDDLRRRVGKLERINSALMKHVERITDQSQGAYSLFQTAIMLDGRVRSRTEEMTLLMDRLEQSNEALVKAKDDAEQANGSKTRFLAAASHDLQQPLSATRLFVAALSDMRLDTDAAAIVNRIDRGLETIAEVITSLLDISKLDAGIVEPVFGQVSMGVLLSELEADYRHLAEQKSIRLIVRCPSQIMIESDAALLRRILDNLVVNAFRYTDHGGVLIAARTRGRRFRIDVVDTGCGIPDGERDRVFDEFFRGRANSGVGAGLGLGLSIVRRLAAALALDISFRSRPSRGTWFQISGALDEKSDTKRWCEPIVDDSRLNDLRVLVVEDDPATLEAMKKLLQGWGALVFTCSDPSVYRDEGARPTNIDLIVADFHLGAGVSGLDVIAAVRASSNRRLPALITTGDRSSATSDLVASEACALLHKPIKPAQLRSILSHLLISSANSQRLRATAGPAAAFES